MDVWAAKTSSNTRYYKPRHSPVPETVIQAFQITINSPWLQLASSLETNSTVVWLYASGISLILPDAWFGMVSQDWVTNVNNLYFKIFITQRNQWRSSGGAVDGIEEMYYDICQCKCWATVSFNKVHTLQFDLNLNLTHLWIKSLMLMVACWRGCHSEAGVTVRYKIGRSWWVTGLLRQGLRKQ